MTSAKFSNGGKETYCTYVWGEVHKVYELQQE